MYNHFTDKLDSSIAKLPEAFQQACARDMVLGQYALVSTCMIWVDEEDAVRLDGAAELETVDSVLPEENYVYAVMLKEGLVLDFVEQEQEKPIKIDKVPLATLMGDENFELERMIDVIWVVGTIREQISLRKKYIEQVGQDRFYIEDIDTKGGKNTTAEPIKQPTNTAKRSGAPKKQPTGNSKKAATTKKDPYDLKDKKQAGQKSADPEELNPSSEN